MELTQSLDSWISSSKLFTREKDKKEENLEKAYMSTLGCGRFPPIYRYLVCGFFIRTFILMFIFTNIHRPYVYDHLGPYISLINTFIDQITPYWSTLINYPHQHIDYLINDRFNPIDMLSCQPVGCQGTPHTLGDMEYIRTPLWNLSFIDYNICIILHPHENPESLRVWSTV